MIGPVEPMQSWIIIACACVFAWSISKLLACAIEKLSLLTEKRATGRKKLVPGGNGP